jgi:hypothetical protein
MGETSTGVVGNLMTLLNAIGQDTYGIWYFISVFCYVGGFICFGLGLVYLARRPQSRQIYGLMPNAWFWSMLIGICLFAFPELLATVSATFIQGNNEISQFDYSGMLKGSGSTLGNCSLNGLRPILQVFGVGFIIRALLSIRRAGVYGSQGQGIGGPTLIILAGVAMIHMQHILGWIYSTTGISLGQMC